MQNTINKGDTMPVTMLIQRKKKKKTIIMAVYSRIQNTSFPTETSKCKVHTNLKGKKS